MVILLTHPIESVVESFISAENMQMPVPGAGDAETVMVVNTGTEVWPDAAISNHKTIKWYKNISHSKENSGEQECCTGSADFQYPGWQKRTGELKKKSLPLKGDSFEW